MALENEKIKCAICGQAKAHGDVMPFDILRPSIQKLMLDERPDLPRDGFVCVADINRYRAKYIENLLETEKGELTELEENVVKSLKERELLSSNVNEAYDQALTLGERAADRIAEFGGSWRFIIVFVAIMAFWVALNSIQLLARPFDPYPYILLNLVLSCIAAMQAPVIMMSQNRQESKDRLRSEYDYQINLKAELEIRQLNEKVDHLIMRQWQRLLEIQQVQMQVMEEIMNSSVRDRQGPDNRT